MSDLYDKVHFNDTGNKKMYNIIKKHIYKIYCSRLII